MLDAASPVGLPSGLEVRPFRADDADAVAAVRDAVRVVEPQAWMPGPDGEGAGAGDQFNMVVRSGDRLIAYTWSNFWLEHNGVRLWLNLGFVHPSWRRRGIGRALLEWQEGTTRLAAAARPDPEVRLEVLGGNADDDQPATRALLRAAGYELAFTVVTMHAVAGSAAPCLLPPGLHERPLGEAEHRRVHAAIGECFQDSSHGFIEHTWDDYRRELAAQLADTSLWCVAWDADEVAGFVLIERKANGTADVPWVGVRRAWRRRGLAQAMLRNAMARCAAAGITMITIRTVEENVNHTIGLYEQVGFTVVRSQPRYRKPL